MGSRYDAFSRFIRLSEEIENAFRGSRFPVRPQLHKKSFRQESRIPQNSEMPSQNRINGASPRRCQEGLALINLVLTVECTRNIVPSKQGLCVHSFQTAKEPWTAKRVLIPKRLTRFARINPYRRTRQGNDFWCLCWQNLIHVHGNAPSTSLP